MTPLHQLGDAIRNLLLGVPLTLVRALFVGSLVLLLCWVLRLPNSEVTPVGGAKRWEENLKVGATAALTIQILIYLLV